MTQSDRIIGGHYEIRQLIGRGGMVQAHVGNDTQLNRVIATKILRQGLARDPVFQARFRREAQVAANLSHPAIVAAYDTGEETLAASDGATVQVPYIVTEYVEGYVVRELPIDGDPVPIDEAIEIASGVLDVLEYARHQNLVYCDIKPGNVMITTTGKVKVMDFGIVRALSDSQTTMTQTGVVVGTTQHLSPEQACGEQVDAHSDLHSIECSLSELSTGKPPFKGGSAVAVAFQHVSQLPPLPSSIVPDIPPVLNRVVMKALAKNRKGRYADAAATRADLNAVPHGMEVTAPDTQTWALLPTTPGGGTTVLPPVSNPAAAAPLDGSVTLGQMPNSNLYRTQSLMRPGTPTKKSRLPPVFTLSAVLIITVLGSGYYWIFAEGEGGASDLVAVPQLKGTNQEEVRTALTEAGLKMTMSPGENSETIAPGLFVKSIPAPGTIVKKDSKVKVVFSTGPGDTVVPSLEGLTQQQARSALKAAGLALGNTSMINSGAIDKDKIVPTNPRQRSPARKGDSVDLQLVSGNVLIPSELQGGTLDVLQKFVGANRANLITFEKETDTAAPGTALSPNKVGQTVALGPQLCVTVVVASPAPPTTPAESPSQTPERSEAPSVLSNSASPATS